MRAAISLITVAFVLYVQLASAQVTPGPRNRRPATYGGPAAAAPSAPTPAPAAVPDVQPVFSRQAAFAIPFTVAQPNRQALEVLLFVSSDAGATWNLFARESALKGQFSFRAGGDGQYWFASRTVPTGAGFPNHAGLAPELKVIVDTTNPELDVHASINQNGQIEVTWEATDQMLAADTVKIEYQAALGQPWKSVPIGSQQVAPDAKSLHGQAAWAPEGGGRFVSIRVQVSDRAGNVNQAIRRLLIPATIVARRPAVSPPSHLAAELPQDPLASQGMFVQHATGRPTAPARSAPSGATGGSSTGMHRGSANSYGSARNPSAYGQNYSRAGNTSGHTGVDAPTSDIPTYGADRYAAQDATPKDSPAQPESVSWPSDPLQTRKYGQPSAGFASSRTRQPTDDTVVDSHTATDSYTAADTYGANNTYGASDTYGTHDAYGTSDTHKPADADGTRNAYGTGSVYGTGNVYGTSSANGSTRGAYSAGNAAQDEGADSQPETSDNLRQHGVTAPYGLPPGEALVYSATADTLDFEIHGREVRVGGVAIYPEGPPQFVTTPYYCWVENS